MAVLIDFQACRGCLAPNINGTFTSLFENPENAARFDEIAEASIADDKDEFAALICDSCLDEMTQAFELRRNLRFLEKISFETRRVKNNLQDVGSSIDKRSKKSVENVDESNKSMSNKAQVELPRLREFYVRIERLEDVNESLDQSRASNPESKPANVSKLSKVKAKELTSNIDHGCHKRQVRDGQISNLADENKVAQPNELINYNAKMPKQSLKSKKCRICQKTYSFNTNLKRHIQTVHQKLKKFICKVCGYKSCRKSHLKHHTQAVHDKIKNLKCDLCDFKSVLKNNLRVHIARHVKNPNYIFRPRFCDTTKSNRPFQCEIENCEKFLKTEKHLNKHKKTHSGEIEYQSSELINNEMTAQKSNQCQICLRSCVNKSKLKLHIDTVHKRIKKFVCKVCGFKFGLRSDLKRHIQAVHDKIKNFKCDLCDFKSSTKRDLQRHIAGHVRNPNFKSKPRDTSNPNRPFKCSFGNCGKFFKTEKHLNKHKETHSDSRPFICSTCFKGFKAERYLKIHQKDVVCCGKF